MSFKAKSLIKKANKSLLESEIHSSKKARIDEIYSRIKKGAHFNDIVDELGNKYGVSKIALRNDYYFVKRVLEDEIIRDIEMVIADHMRKYEKIYQGNKITPTDILSYKEAERRALEGEALYKARNMVQQRILTRVLTCIEALHKKERVMGIHHKKINIQINNINRQIFKDDTQYDLSKLTLEEKIEFTHLLQKSRSDYYYSPILIKQTLLDSPIHDINFEEIIENSGVIEPNKQDEVVSRMKQVKIKRKKEIREAAEVGFNMKDAILRKIEETYAKQDKLRKQQKRLKKKGK